MTLIGIIVILTGVALFVRSLTKTDKAIFGPLGAITFSIGWFLTGMSFAWIAVVTGVIGFFILALSNPSTPRQKGIARSLAILGLLVTIPLGALWAWAYSNEEQSANAQTTLTSLAPTTTIAPRTDCKDGHVVKMPDRGSNNRLNANGVPEEFRNNIEEFRQFILDQAHVDPLTLFLYYEKSPLQKVDPLGEPAELVDNGNVVNGNCYSNRGVSAFNEWSVLWKTTELVAVQQIAHVGSNTGVNGTSPTYANGVSGADQSGFDVTYKDANGKGTARHSVLNRCTQPTSPGLPSKLEGPTDNQQPPSTTSTTQPGVNTTTSLPGSTTTTTRPGGTTTTTQPTGSTTTSTTPTTVVTAKCKLADGSLVPGFDPDGDGFCGSGGTDPNHPVFQPVISEPITNPTLNDPTPGYVPNSAETTSQQQTTATKSPPYTPSPSGQQSPSPSGTSGQTVTPTGTPVTGGTSGVSSPVTTPATGQTVNTTPVVDLDKP